MVVISTIVTMLNISYGPPEWTMHLTTMFTMYSRISVCTVDYTSAPLTSTYTSLEMSVVIVITSSVIRRF